MFWEKWSSPGLFMHPLKDYFKLTSKGFTINTVKKSIESIYCKQ